MTITDLQAASRAERIKQLARDHGFAACGISKAQFLEEEAPRLENWLANRLQGEMSYMERHFDKRLDPRLLVPGARSVVSLLYNYYSPYTQEEGVPKISMYAFGEDYHTVLKDKLHALLQAIQEEFGTIAGRVFVDSAPVMDKAWAARSGLGWIGKNANLISKKAGSYFFIAELIIDLEIRPDAPTTDHCGNCTRCIDACPTGAIIRPYTVDGSKCISYFTIELKGAIPVQDASSFDGWMFGCDICQQVCPWNRFSTPHSEERLAPNEEILSLSQQDWLDITEDVFQELTKRSPLSRPGFEGVLRNVRFIAQESTGVKDS
ncbi:MAG: hypothetical protein RL226_2128 [Bacteroidota bacterium]|jgi:epoxyqueuosine reductase